MGADYDTSQLEDYLIKEDDLLMLGFQGGLLYIPCRVLARTETPFLYDTIAEGMLTGPLAASPSTNGVTSLTIQSPAQIGSKNLPGSPTDVFDITRYPDLVYQAFVGVDPPSLRLTYQQPFRIDQRVVPIIGRTGNYIQSGYISGYQSPLNRPDPKSAFYIAPGMSVAFGFGNPMPQPAFPLLLFWLNCLRVAVVRDVNLVLSMIDGTAPGGVKYATVGGVQAYPYDPSPFYNMRGIRLVMSAADQQAGLTYEESVAAGIARISSANTPESRSFV